MGHNCILCGEELPDRKGGRCYCKACSDFMRAERNKVGNEERKVLQVKHDIKPKPVYVPKRLLNRNDEKYCKLCYCHGKPDAGYLCNYFVITGERRGCPAGVGCSKRRTRS